MKILLSLLLASLLYGDIPDWVKSQGKSAQYPSDQYLTGYGMATNVQPKEKDKGTETAVSYARKNLSEKVRVNIQSIIATKSEETGDAFSSFFSSATQSTSSLEVQGLETETFYHENEETMYAFVFVKRSELISFYTSKVASLQKEIGETIALARTFEDQNNSTRALNEYLSCFPIVRRLEEAQSILASLKLSNTLSEYQESAAANEVSVGRIRESVARLVQRPVKTIDDLAWLLLYQLKEQADQQGLNRIRAMVIPPVYQDTKMGSSFSRFFVQVLEQKLPVLAQWDAVQKESAPYIISGSYWELEKNTVKFILSLRSVKENRIIASAETSVPAALLAVSQRSLKPENYRTALIDQKIFAADETAGGGLTVEAWTNKETTGNLFTEDERMTVTVRVNMPCYLRFVYHLADGKRALLFNEYRMDASKVNTAYTIPQEFECSAPFGSEVLQIFARTDKFESIETESVDGYDYLKEDLRSFVVKTRGFKAVKPAVMQAETRITITTMKE